MSRQRFVCDFSWRPFCLDLLGALGLRRAFWHFASFFFFFFLINTIFFSKFDQKIIFHY